MGKAASTMSTPLLGAPVEPRAGLEPAPAVYETTALPDELSRPCAPRGSRTHTVASNGPPRYPLRHLTMRAPGEIRTPTTQGRSLVLLSVELRALVFVGCRGLEPRSSG